MTRGPHKTRPLLLLLVAAFIWPPGGPAPAVAKDGYSGLLPTRRHPARRIAPDGIYLRNSSGGGYVVVAGSRTVYRLQRRSGKLERLYREHRSLYRVAASRSGRWIAAAYERARDVHLWDTRAPRHLSPSATARSELAFDPAERYLLLYAKRARRFSVQRVELAKPGRAATFFRAEGRLLHGDGRAAVYATFSPKQGRFSVYYSPIYQDVIVRDFTTGKSRTLFSFVRPALGNWVHAYRSPDGRRIAIFVDGRWSRRRLVLVHDLATGHTTSHAVPFGGRYRYGPRVRFSAKGDYLVFCVRQPRRTVVVRLDPATGRLTRVANLPASGRRSRGRPYGFGVLADNQTIWIHHGDQLVLLRGGRRTSTNLRRLSRRARPEWAGATYYFPAPDQLYVGIERGGGRYFMKVDLSRVTRP